MPNALSVVRLCCIPLFLYLLFGRDNRGGAGWLLGCIGLTDWVDGYVARRFNQVSELGKILDPAADRLMFIVSIIGILIVGTDPMWFYWLVIARETVIGVTMVVATLAGMKRFDVTWWGKTATFLLMFAIPGFLIGSSDFRWHREMTAASWVLGIPGLILSYWTAFAYVPVIRENLRLGRQERANKTLGSRGV